MMTFERQKGKVIRVSSRKFKSDTLLAWCSRYDILNQEFIHPTSTDSNLEVLDNT